MTGIGCLASLLTPSVGLNSRSCIGMDGHSERSNTSLGTRVSSPFRSTWTWTRQWSLANIGSVCTLRMTATSKVKVSYELHRGSFSTSSWEREITFDRAIDDSQKNEELVLKAIRGFHHPESQLSLTKVKWL